MDEQAGAMGPGEGPGPLRRLAYRLHLHRLPPTYREWVSADLARPGARLRFVASAAGALGGFWLLYVVLFDLPRSTFGAYAVLVGGCLFLMTRPRAWTNLEEAVHRRHGIATVAQIAGAREGAGSWVDGQWWCDAHGTRFCRDCAPRTER